MELIGKHMYGLSALAFATPPTTPQASVASMIAPATTPSLGAVPTQFVAQPLPDADVRDRGARAGAYASANAAAPTQLEEEGAVFFGAANPRMSDTYVRSFPSLFFAQLLAQESGGEAAKLAASYDVLVRTPEAVAAPQHFAVSAKEWARGVAVSPASARAYGRTAEQNRTFLDTKVEAPQE